MNVFPQDIVNSELLCCQSHCLPHKWHCQEHSVNVVPTECCNTVVSNQI
jgi:hypothetical protein